MPFFSSVDDKSELGFPGFHATIGSLFLDKLSFGITASVVNNFKRYCIDANHYMELSKDGVSTYDTKIAYHPSVLNQLQIRPNVRLESVFGNHKDMDALGIVESNMQQMYRNSRHVGSLFDFTGTEDAIYSELEKAEFEEFKTSIERQFVTAVDNLGKNSLFEPAIADTLLAEFANEVIEIENTGYDVDSMKDLLLSFCNNTFAGLDYEFRYNFK
jgi:hypothetical protein